MRMLPFLLLTVLLAAGPAPAQEIGDSAPYAAPGGSWDEILLKDGNVLRGNIVEEREDVVVFESESIGRLEIPRANIKRLARRNATSGVFADPDQNTIMFCPTPATLPKGDAYFRDFELFILNFGAGLTDALDVSVGTLFPISSDVLMLSVGAKVRLVDRDAGGFGLALTGSYTRLEEIQFGSLGGVAGIGNARRSLNLALNYAFNNDGDNETYVLIGGDVQTGRSSKFIAEYFNASQLLDDETDDLHGFINLGVRFFGENHSFSLTGFRPLVDDSGSFIAFPMVMYSRHF